MHPDPRSVSVVVPAYNRADLISATLEALFAQTRRATEIIVVDDGSKDDTLAVLRRYEPRIKVIPIANGGELVARNTGIRAARGDLVAFCDSDDLWKPDFLEVMTGLWQREPGLRAAYCNTVIVRDDVWATKTKFDDAPPGYWDGLRPIGPDTGVFDTPTIERLIRFQPFLVSAMVADRAFFLSLGGWDEAASRLVGCDFATTLRVGEHPPIGVVRRPLAGIRKHGDNFSGDVQAMNLGDARVLELVLQNRPTLAPYRDQILASMARRRRDALEIAFARRDFDSVRRIYDMLPGAARTRAVAVKRRVAGLPAHLRAAVAEVLLAAGSLRRVAGR